MIKSLVVRHLPLYILALALALATTSCDHSLPKGYKTEAAMDTAALSHIDSITIYCDEAFKYLIDQEAAIYEVGQPGLHLHLIYLPEADVLHVLMTDSFSTVVLGRRLRDSEKEELYKHNRIQPDERCFARDAVAIIANPDFEHDTLSYDLVSRLIAGTASDYRLVFEGNGSGVMSYMFGQFNSTKRTAFAAKNTDELIGYLQKDKKTIGFIPFDKISDDDMASSRELLKKVKVLSVARPDSTGKIHVTMASQSEIADGSYPFSRPVNFISHSMDDKVGTGFVSFLYHDQSGRIILKTGLVPAIMPSRVININTAPVK